MLVSQHPAVAKKYRKFLSPCFCDFENWEWKISVPHFFSRIRTLINGSFYGIHEKSCNKNKTSVIVNAQISENGTFPFSIFRIPQTRIQKFPIVSLTHTSCYQVRKQGVGDELWLWLWPWLIFSCTNDTWLLSKKLYHLDCFSEYRAQQWQK